MANYKDLKAASDDALTQIKHLQWALIQCVAHNVGCSEKCDRKQWDNPRCVCVNTAKGYPPVNMRK